jgi:RNA polymerase sigma-70 factor (ECF subfamily)
MDEAGSSGGSVPVRALSAETAQLRPVVRAVIAAVLKEPLSHEDVEDCTHETIRRALESDALLDTRAAFRPWLLGVARHVALDAIRRRRRERARAPLHGSPADNDDPSTPALDMPDGAPDPFERMAQARTGSEISRALEALPDGQRQALLLFHLDGLEYQQIATRLGVPLGTVATWVTRGRKALAAALREREREGRTT